MAIYPKIVPQLTGKGRTNMVATTEPTTNNDPLPNSDENHPSIGFEALEQMLRSSMRVVNHKLIEFGYEVWLQETESGKKRITGWIKRQVPDAQKEVNDAKAIAQFADGLPQYIDQMLGWGRSTLATLAKGYLSLEKKIVKKVNNLIRTLLLTVHCARYSPEHVTVWILWGQQIIQNTADILENLVNTALAGKPKAAQIVRSLIKETGVVLETTPYLDPNKEATESDWQQLVWDRYEVSEGDRETLIEHATSLALDNTDPDLEPSQIVVKVAHIQATLEYYAEILSPKISHRRSGKSGAAPISMRDYNELIGQLQNQRQQIEALKQENAQLQTPASTPDHENELYSQALEQVRIEYAASVAGVRSELETLRGTIQQSDTAIASLNLENKTLKNQVVSLQTALEQTRDSSPATTQSPKPVQPSLDKNTLETAPITQIEPASVTEVEQTVEYFEMVFGSKPVLNAGIYETFSSLSLPVLQSMQQLAESLLFFTNSGQRKSSRTLEEDFAFEENQSLENWEPA